MTTAPAPIMPLPPTRVRVRRYLVASREHAERLFAPETTARTVAVAALLREEGAAIVVETYGGTTIATVRLANGYEVAEALAGVPGAVTFMVANGLAAPAGTCDPVADCGPPSRDPSLAAVEVEVVRLRRVEAAARALLASLPQCMTCKRVATKSGGPPGMDWHICDRHADSREHDVEHAVEVRALEALLAPTGVEVAS